MIDTTNIQKRLRAELVLRYGADTMRPYNRATRFGEEALEVLRAFGLTVYEVVNLVNYVFDEQKDDGETRQEVAQAGLLLLALADSSELSLGAEFERELQRIEKTPLIVSRSKHALKAALGIAPEAVLSTSPVN